MKCEEARDVYSNPIGLVRRDKLREATEHIEHCEDCQNYFKTKFQRRKSK